MNLKPGDTVEAQINGRCRVGTVMTNTYTDCVGGSTTVVQTPNGTFQVPVELTRRVRGNHPSTAEQVRGLLIIAGGLFVTWAVAMCVVVL